MKVAIDFSGLLRSFRSHVIALRLPLLAIILPLAVRTIPEILAGPWPLGFDTVWVYAPFVHDVEVRGFGPAFLDLGATRSAPLLYLVLAVVSFAHPDPFFVVKAAAPVLFAFFVFSVFHFARRGLGWDDRRCLFVVILATLYFVPLRFSWDMYKNTLGYAFFILALGRLAPRERCRDTVLFLVLATLSILASELTATLLVASGALLVARAFIQRKSIDLPLLAIAIVSGFATLIYSGLLFPPTAVATPLAPLPTHGTVLVNYIGIAEDVYHYSNVFDLYVAVLSLAAITLGPLLPVARLGLHVDSRLIAWSAPLAAAAFSPLVVPVAAAPAWHRWLLMLALPVLLTCAAGLAAVGRKSLVAFVVILVILSSTFLILPPSKALPYFASPLTTVYVPSSMMQNTLPLTDAPEVVDALCWLNDAQGPRAVLVAHTSFVGWAKLYSTVPEVYPYVEKSQVDGGNFSAYAHVYLIYWAPGLGWFNSALLPARAVEVHGFGDVAIYEMPP